MGSYKKYFFALLFTVAIMISGCVSTGAAMDELAGIGKLTVEDDKFNQATRVRLTPSWIAIEQPAGLKQVADFMLGAIWSTDDPDIAFIHAEIPNFSEINYEGIRGVAFSFGGEQVTYNTSRLTSFDGGESANFIPIPMELLEYITSSPNDVRVRLLLLGNEYMEGLFSADVSVRGNTTMRKHLKSKWLPMVAEARKQ